MRTNRNTAVKALVAKYKNLAKESEAAIAVKNDIALSEKLNVGIDYDFHTIAFEQQLLAHFYFLKANGSADAYVTEQWRGYAQAYQDGLLSTEEESFLIENFDLLVDYLLDDPVNLELSAFCSRAGWDRLAEHLLIHKDGAKVFIPRTGVAHEISGLNNCSVLVGEGYEYAAVRATISNLNVQKYTEPEDHGILKFWPDLDKASFDVFIAEVGFPELFDINTCLQAAYALVRDGGELLLCIDRRTIIGDDTRDFRKMIAEKHELAEAIELPNQKTLLHIVKSEQSSFVMSDASKVTIDKGWGHSYKVLDVDRYLEMVKHYDQPEFDKSPIARKYDFSRLKEEVFLPEYYLLGSEGISLGSIVNVPDHHVQTDACSAKEKVVIINNLSHVFSKGEIAPDNLKTLDVSRFREYWRVDSPCVILALSHDAIAVGYKVGSDSVLVPKNLKVLLTKSTDEARYIAACALSDGVRKQICSLTDKYGRTCDNWLNFVKIPSLSEEERKEYVRNVSRSDWQEQEKTALAASERYRHEIRLRKHALSQNISSFDSLFRTLMFCFEDQGGIIRKSDRISPVSDLTAEGAFKQLLKNLNDICERVNHIAEDQNWGESESIEPQQFIEEFERKHTCENFKFTHSWEVYETNRFEQGSTDIITGKVIFHPGEPCYAAWFPKDALTQVIENIVANAQSHGFVDASRDDYQINFDWSTDGLNMLIHIANNGSPVPNDMSTGKILQYGYTSALNRNGHGGIGGGQIAEIMEKYGGSAKVLSTPDDRYTVTYVLSMPLASSY